MNVSRLQVLTLNVRNQGSCDLKEKIGITRNYLRGNLMLPTGISELEGLSYLEDLAEEYKGRSGAVPFNLSLWNPSEFMMNSLLKFLHLPVPPLPIPYIYSDEESKQQVLERLGFIQSKQTCAFVQAGTNASLLAAVWLKALNFKRTLVLCPATFLSSMHLKY